jgi:hypothetical protein
MNPRLLPLCRSFPSTVKAGRSGRRGERPIMIRAAEQRSFGVLEMHFHIPFSLSAYAIVVHPTSDKLGPRSLHSIYSLAVSGTTNVSVRKGPRKGR